jgi:hypothetical protein
MKIRVRYEGGHEGEFGPFPDKNVAYAILVHIVNKPNVVSAILEEPRIIG